MNNSRVGRASCLVDHIGMVKRSFMELLERLASKAIGTIEILPHCPSAELKMRGLLHPYERLPCAQVLNAAIEGAVQLMTSLLTRNITSACTTCN